VDCDSATSGAVREPLKSNHLLGGRQFALRQEVVEVHLRTQRRAGELLLAMAKHRGGGPLGTSSRAAWVSILLFTLRELGPEPALGVPEVGGEAPAGGLLVDRLSPGLALPRRQRLLRDPLPSVEQILCDGSDGNSTPCSMSG
jgi:hypothetical protein